MQTNKDTGHIRRLSLCLCFVYLHVCTHMFMYVCLCVFMCLHTRIHVCVHLRMYVYRCSVCVYSGLRHSE